MHQLTLIQTTNHRRDSFDYLEEIVLERRLAERDNIRNRLAELQKELIEADEAVTRAEAAVANELQERLDNANS